MHQFKIFLAIVFLACSCHAVPKSDFCSVTKNTTNDFEPETFLKSNNLLKKAGQEVIISGDKIVIYGKVLDQHCLPVSDAKVYIWQVNGQGKYPYEPLRNIAKGKLIDNDNYTTFTGNGTATTNNKGEFVFLTIKPAGVHDLKPHINVRAEHYIFNNIQSKFILDDSKIIDSIDDQNANSIISYSKANDLPIYNYEIIMPGFGMKKYSDDN